MPIQKIRDTKISANFVGLVEIQEKKWQFMIENFVGRTETFYLKEKIILKELKTLKEIEKKYKIYRRMYTIQEYDSSFELMKSFDIFYYLNGRFPYTNGLLWVPNDDKPNIISGEKLSLKRLYKLFCGTHPHGLVSMQFLATLNLFLGGKEVIS